MGSDRSAPRPANAATVSLRRRLLLSEWLYRWSYRIEWRTKIALGVATDGERQFYAFDRSFRKNLRVLRRIERSIDDA